MRSASNRLFRSPIPALALFVGVVTAACSASYSDPAARPSSTDSLKAKLLGSWTLVSACGGLTGACRSLNEVTVPDRYLFRSDDSVDAYRAGQHRFATNYMISPGATDSTLGDTRPLLLIGYGPTIDPMPLRVAFLADTVMLLDEGCCDRYTFQYRRLR